MFASSQANKIGQCSICLSTLHFSNIYAIIKCGHTFHQKCINQWITNAKNCPSCRTNATKSDIIKLFIQENIETIIPKKEESLPYIETKHNDFCRRKLKDCKCEILKYKTGDLQYNCLKDFDVNIYSCIKNDRITVILPNEIIVKISRSKKLVILRQKTNEKSIVTPDGTRYEYFNVPNGSQQDINVIYHGQQYQRNLQEIEKPLTIRSDKDFVRTDKNRTKFCFLGFTVKQSLFSINGRRITIRVYTKDSNKSMRIRICPKHQSFFVEHLLENKINRCTNSEFLCEHL